MAIYQRDVLPVWPDNAVVPQHLLPCTSRISGSGELLIGGLPVADIVEEHGSPLFIYDEEHIRRSIRAAKDNFSGTVAYASKAFLCTAMARLVAEEGIHLDAASAGEIFVALRGGVRPSEIVFHGNNKSLEELRYAVEVGVGRIVVDSFDEIDRLVNVATGPVDVWIRVTPGIEAHTHEFVRTGQDDSKFGFNVGNGDAERAASILRRSKHLRLRGIHAHIGSQIFALHSFDQEVEVVAAMAHAIAAEEVNLGGGLGVAYLRYEEAPSLEEWVRGIDSAAKSHGLDRTSRLFIEPGRSLIATAAITVYRVGTVKQIPGVRRYVAIDGGMSDNPRPVLYGSGYEAFLPQRMVDHGEVAFTVAGKHCESGDLLVRDALLPADLSVGELLATPVTGAYGYAMSSNYNRIPRPAVVFVSEGEYTVVVRRETLDDLVRLDS